MQILIKLLRCHKVKVIPPVFRKFASLKIFMTASKKHITVLSFVLLLAACGKKEKELSPAQIRAKADSIMQTKLGKLKQQAKEDLDRRLPIEVKPKVDSILKISHDVGQVPVFPDDNIGVDNVEAPATADSAKK